MKVLTYPRFPYPSFWQGQAWCDVDVYRQGLNVLVVLRDQADHEGTSVTNALEIVARAVRERLLAPQGLERMTTYWVRWSRTSGVASTVAFRDPERLEGPTWQYLSPEEFQKILAGFEAPDLLETWIREGALDLEGWTESSGEHRRRSN